MAAARPAPHERLIPRHLQIDFLFLDLTTCTRCRGTDRSLAEALDATRDVLAAAGAKVEVNKIHVTSAEQARELRFESSPTIRIDGRDIALELRESECGSEACACGGGEHIDCRVWVHQGREYTEPPVELVVDAILREVYAGGVVEREIETTTYALPENLARFFASGAAVEAASPVEDEACCSPEEQGTCCELEDKAECCGTSAGAGCGCR
jgi:hypothetical protein